MEGKSYADAVKKNLVDEETAMEIALRRSLQDKVLHLKYFNYMLQRLYDMCVWRSMICRFPIDIVNCSTIV